MPKNNLYITVPTFFRCPISLDVMKSPVSLCTGVTYDRTSIQRWLDSGNNTCPATMQILQTKDLVPNKNLQRLIQIWSTESSCTPPRTESSKLFTSQNDVVRLVHDLKSDDPLLGLESIECFARECHENRQFLAGFDGFLEACVDLLSSGKVSLIEFAVRIIVVIVESEDHKKSLKNFVFEKREVCLNAMVLVLKVGKLSSKVASAKLIELIAYDAESKVLVAETDGLLSVLVELVSSGLDSELVESGLSCLIAVSKPKRVKTKLVELQVVRIVSGLLMDTSSSVSVIEKGLKILEMVSSCKEGRTEICNDAGCVSGVVQKVLKVSTVATEHAVTILWSVCYLFRDGKAQESVLKSNGLTKILLIMQSNCSPGVRQMAGDLIKVFRVNCKSCLGSYETKTTHIMPF